MPDERGDRAISGQLLAMAIGNSATERGDRLIPQKVFRAPMEKEGGVPNLQVKKHAGDDAKEHEHGCLRAAQALEDFFAGKVGIVHRFIEHISQH